ncbi:MAG TPA: 3-hydroxyacyl-CoA dehydrogenase family protein [Solirubrobacteraceae bacterium]|jgi:3-hydroxyacyl-CoA dehydrogenase|nr:3-hydroxyacyl-CoA dehydrogenase family protein [Solirubrobacteraceae bacterium]
MYPPAALAERLGIVGGGAIACGIARVAAEHGDVVMWVRSEESARRVKAPEDVAVTTDLGELAGADVVVEAIAEDVEAKADLYRRLPALDGALLATTTSSLSVNELAAASGRAERFFGLHVFNPVHRMELVELAFPDAATPDTRERARALCAHLGKTAVEVPDVPGFVVNRLLFPYLFSAVRLLEETGLEPEAVDTCMKLGAGHPMGPLALLDLVGLDVSIAIGETIGAEIPARIRSLAAEGALGRKAGRGFFSYAA